MCYPAFPLHCCSMMYCSTDLFYFLHAALIVSRVWKMTTPEENLFISLCMCVMWNDRLELNGTEWKMRWCHKGQFPLWLHYAWTDVQRMDVYVDRWMGGSEVLFACVEDETCPHVSSWCVVPLCSSWAPPPPYRTPRNGCSKTASAPTHDSFLTSQVHTHTHADTHSKTWILSSTGCRTVVEQQVKVAIQKLQKHL